MSQNTYTPDNWGDFTLAETVPDSLQKPFNPDRVAELVNAQFLIPPTMFRGIGADDTLLSVGLPNPVTQADIDAAIAKLNAVCVDPTRGDLTADQQEAQDMGDIDAQIVDIRADRDLLRGKRVNRVQTTAGDRDHVNGGTFGLTGIKPPMVKATFDALASDRARLEALRFALMGNASQKGIVDILLDLIDSDVHGTNADIETLQDVKKLLAE